MIISDVSLESYRWPRLKPIRNGRYIYPNSGLDIVKIETKDGITGVGLAGGGGGDDVGIRREILERLKMYVIGQDPFDTERIWDEMWQPKLVGRRGMTTHVVSGIDIALWDLKGKITGKPVHKLLGGYTDNIPVYIAGGYYEEGKSLEDLAHEMQEALSLGATAVKMKIGGVSIAEDVERVKVVREAIGADAKLMVDANCAYRYYEAIEIAKRIEGYDIFWFEEPVNPDDYRGHKLISESTIIPIATGENEYTKYGFRDLIETRSAAILQPDALVMGGITEFIKVAGMAQSHDLPIAAHGTQEVHIQLMAAIPNGLILEYYSTSTDPLRGEMFLNELKVKDGFVQPPQTVGMGMEPNYRVLSKYRVK